MPPTRADKSLGNLGGSWTRRASRIVESAAPSRRAILSSVMQSPGITSPQCGVRAVTVAEACGAVKHFLEASTADRSGPAVRTTDYVDGFGSNRWSVDDDLLGGFWLGAFVGSFNDLAVDE